MNDENGAPPLSRYYGVCTSCGKFIELNPFTGWCENCTPASLRSGYISRTEVSLAANANAIEYFVTTTDGTISIWKALKLATGDRPVCIVCGNRITRSARNSIFCRRTKECRRYSRRYVYLYREKGMSKVEALALVLGELTGD